MKNVANITPAIANFTKRARPRGAVRQSRGDGLGRALSGAGSSSHLDVVLTLDGPAVPVEQPEGAARPQCPPEVPRKGVDGTGDLADYPPADCPGGDSYGEPSSP